MAPSFTTILCLVSLLTQLGAAASQSRPSLGLVQRSGVDPSNTVIVQMFEWNWDSVANECQKFLGPAGYGFVQISPAQEHISGSQWWTDYQPVSYTISSKRGNRAQYQNMVTKCHSAGVGVIADTILNHMAGIDSGTGVAGTTFTHYNYPGLYQSQDFHHCGLEKDDNIVDYGNRLEVQTCQLVGLADLATNTTYVQQTLAKYVNDLVSLGVDGFRLDASKHIAATEIATIFGLVNGKPYITQEITHSAVDVIQPNEYIGNGDVQEFRYVTAIREAFTNGSISSLKDLDNLGWVPGNQANIFVANHDTERDGSSLNITSPLNTYIMANVFSLAHPYGRPSVLSSYQFSTTDDGAPNGGTGTCSGNRGSGGWHCQHRFTPITGMVGFRNNVKSSSMTDWVSPQPSQIAFGRGSLGFVAINNADTPWTSKFSTSLPDGVYCDVISGTNTGSACSGKTIPVSRGSFSATIDPRNALALHTAAESTSPHRGATNSAHGSRLPLATWLFLALGHFGLLIL